MNIHRMIRKYFIASELLNSATKSELLSNGCRGEKSSGASHIREYQYSEGKKVKNRSSIRLDLKDLYQKRKTAGLPTVFLFKEML